MDRRLVGGLVLVVALMAALAGNARTKQVAGYAGRGPLPDPPAVGDCVLEALPGPSFYGGFNGYDGSADPPAAETAPCIGNRYGEIIAVIPDGLDYVAPADGDTWGDELSPDRRCSEAADAYLGIEDDSYGLGRWFPATSVEMARIGPGPVLMGAGQRWLACALGVSKLSDGAPSTHMYSRTLHDALATLQLPPEVAECAAALPGAAGSVELFSCDRPHMAELLAFASTERPDVAIERRLIHDCTELARTLTGLADLTADGRLRVRVTAVQLPPDSADTERDAIGPMQYFCGIEATTGHLLTGPLLGLGDEPVPVR